MLRSSLEETHDSTVLNLGTIEEKEMSDESEIEFTIGENTDLRITKEGQIQIKVRRGTALYKQKGRAAFTTTSTTFVDITGAKINLPKEISTKKKQNKLKRIANQIKSSKTLRKLAKKFPLELVWLDVDFGVIRARFKPKKKK